MNNPFYFLNDQNSPSYQLMREKHLTLRATQDQQRNDISIFKDAAAQTRKHMQQAQRERESYRQQIEVQKQNFEQEVQANESARLVYNRQMEYYTSTIEQLYAPQVQSERRFQALCSIKEYIQQNRASKLSLLSINCKLENEVRSLETMLTIILSNCFESDQVTPTPLYYAIFRTFTDEQMNILRSLLHRDGTTKFNTNNTTTTAINNCNDTLMQSNEKEALDGAKEESSSSLSSSSNIDSNENISLSPTRIDSTNIFNNNDTINTNNTEQILINGSDNLSPQSMPWQKEKQSQGQEGQEQGQVGQEQDKLGSVDIINGIYSANNTNTNNCNDNNSGNNNTNEMELEIGNQNEHEYQNENQSENINTNPNLNLNQNQNEPKNENITTNKYVYSQYDQQREMIGVTDTNDTNKTDQDIKLRLDMLKKYEQVLEINDNGGVFNPCIFFTILREQSQNNLKLHEHIQVLQIKLENTTDELRILEEKYTAQQNDLQRYQQVLDTSIVALEQSEIERQLLLSQLESSDIKMEYLQQQLSYLVTIYKMERSKLQSYQDSTTIYTQRLKDVENALKILPHEQYANETLQNIYNRVQLERNTLIKQVQTLNDTLSIKEHENDILTKSLANLLNTKNSSKSVDSDENTTRQDDNYDSKVIVNKDTSCIKCREKDDLISYLQNKVNTHTSQNRQLISEYKALDEVQKSTNREVRRLQKYLNDITGNQLGVQMDSIDTFEKIREYGKYFQDGIHILKDTSIFNTLGTISPKQLQGIVQNISISSDDTSTVDLSLVSASHDVSSNGMNDATVTTTTTTIGSDDIAVDQSLETKKTDIDNIADIKNDIKVEKSS